jgi:uncharacterized protein (TIRG00374 family)
VTAANEAGFRPDRAATLKILVGFAVAGLLVYLLGWVVGWEATIERLARADLRWLAVACLSTAVGLALWGKAWQVVLRELGIGVPYRKLVTTYFAATFANYVTPLGQAGGEPFIAYVLARDTSADYEQSLASVVTADLLNLLPFFNFAAVGLGYLLVRSQLVGAAQNVAIGLAAMAVGVPLAVVVGWRHRGAVERALLRLAAPVAARTDRFDLEGLRGRIDRFYEAVGQIAGNRRRLAYALLFSYAGWVCFALPLYFAGLTLGVDIGLLLVLFVVPASTVAGMVPTPGGLAAVEGALVALLVGLTALGAADALAVATIYRLASYWFALLVGGVATLVVIYRV